MPSVNAASGTVVAVHGEGDRRTAVIDVRADAVCARCAAGKGCGAGIFGKRQSLRRIEVTVPERATIKTGDTVSLVMPSRELLAASAIVYGWPLAGGVGGALLAWVAGGSDAMAALLALAGIGVGAWLASGRARNDTCLQRFTPRIQH